MIYRLMKQGLAALSSIGLGMAFAANFDQLQHDITANPNIHVGMQVLDSATGQSLYQYQAQQYFHPASTTKLFTAISAMLSLGGDYRFNTTLQVVPTAIQGHTLKGNVYIKLSGDPSFTSGDLHNLLASLKQAGINKIQGNIVLDNTIFSADTYAFGVPQEDDIWSYGAKSSSIIIDENTFWVNFRSTTTSHPIVVSVDPSIIQVHSHLIWLNAQNADLCTFRVDAVGNNVTLKGCLPPQLGTSIALAVPDPNRYAMSLVQQDLQSLGIKVSGQVITGAMPAKASKILESHASAPLNILLTHMLKVSDNLYASAIAKTMGLKEYSLGTEKAGVVAIQNILAPFNLPKYYLESASGVSDLNLVTPTVMTDLLYQANQNPALANFLSSALPIVGVDGTLEGFPAAVLKDKIIAKTGTLTNVSTLAGFMQTATGHIVIFSLLIDNAPFPQKALKAFEARVLADLYTSGV